MAMPFPLAHPAAVLPLKRFCPHGLSLPALVVGALSPDAAYLFGGLQLEELSHRPLGLVAFCLPAGLVLLLLLYRLRSRLLAILPEHLRPVFLPDRWRPAGSASSLVLSLLLGTASHMVWDSFTHQSGWAVEQIPALATVVGTFAGHNVRVCRVLWYGSSFVGVAAVYLAYIRAQSAPGRATTFSKGQWGEAVVVGALVLPIELVHELVPNPGGGATVAVLSFLVVAGVLWKSQARPARAKAGRVAS